MLRHVSFDGEPPPVPWVCDGLVARGCLTVLAGEAGQGKSWLALGLAKGVCEGRSIAGIPCQKGNVMYVDAENGYMEMHRRVRALDLNGECSVYLAEGFDLGTHQPGLAHHLATERPSLLVLDGLRSLWPDGDENDSARVIGVLDPLREMLRYYEVGCVLLHHLSKAGSYRGSTAIAASPEILVNMYKREGTNVRLLRWQKCRIANMPPTAHEFKIVNGPTGGVILDANS
jgi:RecA-family ATPase